MTAARDTDAPYTASPENIAAVEAHPALVELDAQIQEVDELFTRSNVADQGLGRRETGGSRAGGPRKQQCRNAKYSD